jgi:hypothetical protein
MRTYLLGLWAAGAVVAVACGQTAPDSGDAGDGGGGVDVVADVVKADVVAKDAPADVTPDVVVPFDAGPPPPIGGKPPPPPDAGAPTTNTYTFAIHTIYLGETPYGGGPPSSSAWKNFGYDVDGTQTTNQSSNVCTLYAGASKSVQVDGTNGIDNAWGANILPIIQSAASLPAPSTDETTAIDQGAFTLQIQVTGLSDDPQQSALGLTSQLFVSGAYGNGTPTFDTSTDWPVLSTSVKDGTTIASGSTVQFASSYVSGGVFVSGTTGAAIPLNFSTNGTSLPIIVHDGVITFTHPSHSDAAYGVISGVLYTQEFIDALQALAGQISTSLCGSAFDGIADQIRQAQEIMNDGTNGPNESCNAISIGIGFDAVLVHDPTTVVTATPPPPNPCGD